MNLITGLNLCYSLLCLYSLPREQFAHYQTALIELQSGWGSGRISDSVYMQPDYNSTQM